GCSPTDPRWRRSSPNARSFQCKQVSLLVPDYMDYFAQPLTQVRQNKQKQEVGAGGSSMYRVGLFIIILVTTLCVSTATAGLPGFLFPGLPGGGGGSSLSYSDHFPARPAESAALVVVLHGCVQTGDGFARDAGWNELSDKYGFYVLYPQENSCGNPLSCFN